MTSEDQTSPPPGAYPPPPPGGAAPPPPPPPPGAYYPPQPPAAGVPVSAPGTPPQVVPQQGSPSARPPKKKGKGGIIALVVALLVLCGLGACVAVFLFSGSGEKSKIAQAETHFTNAETAVGAAESAIASATAAGTGEAMTSSVAAATKSIRTARDEVASARATAETLKDSQGKTDYLASLAAATSALDGLENLIRYLDTASGMVAKANEAGAIAKKANEDLDDAIGYGNDSSYSKMRSKAVAARDGYAKATVLFEEADKLDPSAGLAKVTTYTRKRKEQSDVVIRMADNGKAGRLSAYNDDIKKQAALGKDAMAAGTPEILDDPKWAEKRLADLSTSIMADAEKTDTLREKALKELDYIK